MRIIASRKDDIIRRRDEYDSAYNAKKSAYESEVDSWYQAQNDRLAPIKTYVEELLAPFDALTFDVRVEYTFRDMVRVSVQCNEYNKFEDNVALSWNYDAMLGSDGEVKKETGSWSGLKATTEAQLESLEQTLKALQALNAVNWSEVLNVGMPDFKDFVKSEHPNRSDRPDFEQELLEADIEECIGADVLIAAKHPSGRKAGKYFMITRQTPKQYSVIELMAYELNMWRNEGTVAENIEKRKNWVHNTAKSKFMSDIQQPIETLNISDMSDEKLMERGNLF